MKVPFSWLTEYIDPGMSAVELASKLTMAGLEAEKLEIIGADWEQVFVGYVNDVQAHPNADRLRLVDVSAGEHRLTVVTGAPNIATGQKVALALVGASLIDGHSDSGEKKKLKPVNMRGVMSEGMVCSEKELGLSDEHEGILVLPEDAPVGVPLQEYLGDIVIEFEITPNLVHDFSILGIALETHALTGNPVSDPVVADLSAFSGSGLGMVTIDSPDLCNRYVGVEIQGIDVGPSPPWLARRLNLAGIRSINNIVDITNYVMQEFGQPLHAFDATRLKENRVVIRQAKSGEEIETLDHTVRKLYPGMLVIADAERPVAIAGVMGGFEAEVTDATTTILLEGANFDMKSVRHTSRDLKLRTDASVRFERGIDAELAGSAIARAVQLILDLNPEAAVRRYADKYPVPAIHRTLTMQVARFERVIGVSYSDETITTVLARLGFEPEIANGQLTVQIPTWRRDVSLAEDIIEEVARIVGYETLPATLPIGQTPEVRRDPIYQLQRIIRRTLTGAGAFEAVTYVMVDEDLIRQFNGGLKGPASLFHEAPAESLLKARNPVMGTRNLLRTGATPNLLEALSANLRHEPTVQLFELARGYQPVSGQELPTESNLLTIAIAGARDPLSRFARSGSLDYFDLKGLIELTLSRITNEAATFQPIEHPALHHGRSAGLFLDGNLMGVLGELRPDVAASFGIEAERTGVAELSLDFLLPYAQQPPDPVRTPRFLPVSQDFSLVVPGDTDASAVEKLLRSSAGPLLSRITLFDLYQGEQVGEGMKSLAYRLTFTAPDRALTDAELVSIRTRIEKDVKRILGGAMRVS